MRIKELYLGMLMISSIIFAISCSKDATLSTVMKNKKRNDTRNVFYPARIIAITDSIMGISFFQTAVPYYLNLKEAKSKKNLKIIRKAHQEMAMIYVEIDENIPYGKIIDVELAPAYFTQAFQHSLHWAPGKP